jgi:hypothetical protein
MHCSHRALLIALCRAHLRRAMFNDDLCDRRIVFMRRGGLAGCSLSRWRGKKTRMVVPSPGVLSTTPRSQPMSGQLGAERRNSSVPSGRLELTPNFMGARGGAPRAVLPNPLALRSTAWLIQGNRPLGCP